MKCSVFPITRTRRIRRNRQRLEHRGADIENRRPGDPVERGTDRCRALSNAGGQALRSGGVRDARHQVALDAQLTWFVRFSVEPFEKVPTAENWSVSPLGTLALAGVTAIDSRLAAAVATN